MTPFDCVDGFNWAFWRRPEQYLDPEVRACMSGLAMLSDHLVARRMDRLRADLADGTWHARHGGLLDMDTIDGGVRWSFGGDRSGPLRPRTGWCGRMSTPAAKGAGAWVLLTSI